MNIIIILYSNHAVVRFYTKRQCHCVPRCHADMGHDDMPLPMSQTPCQMINDHTVPRKVLCVYPAVLMSQLWQEVININTALFLYFNNAALRCGQRSINHKLKMYQISMGNVLRCIRLTTFQPLMSNISQCKVAAKCH